MLSPLLCQSCVRSSKSPEEEGRPAATTNWEQFSLPHPRERANEKKKDSCVISNFLQTWYFCVLFSLSGEDFFLPLFSPGVLLSESTDAFKGFLCAFFLHSAIVQHRQHRNTSGNFSPIGNVVHSFQCGFSFCLWNHNKIRNDVAVILHLILMTYL